MWAAFAPLLSDGPIVVLMVLILTQTPIWFLAFLRIAGGIFLVYLAWGAYQAFKTAVFSQPSPDKSKQTILEAALMNALSPNPYIFWATVAGPILIQGWRASPSFGISFIVGFYGTLIGGFLAFVALFAVARRLDTRVNRILSGVSAMALLGFGIYQLLIGIQELLS